MTMVARDNKGRFVSTKENKNMNKNARMEALNNAGVNTNGFFNVNLQVPFGAKLEVMVDGKRIEVPSNGVFGVDIAKGSDVADIGSLVEQIQSDGYVQNAHLWRRFVMAHTFRMMSYPGGWNAALNAKPYKYQFEMLIDELHSQSRIYHDSADEYRERNQFFNKDVVVALCDQYLYQLKKFVKRNRVLKYNSNRNRKEYCVVLQRYGLVWLADIDKIYSRIRDAIDIVSGSASPMELESNFRWFYKNNFNKLPSSTPKCQTWRTAFMASGAFYSLKNGIMFHDIVLDGCVGMNDSLDELNHKVLEYKGTEGWRLHEYMKKTFEDRNFDLAKSIEEHK